ncbi:unnamed protein product, partial [Closterium sp. NIES-54]
MSSRRSSHRVSNSCCHLPLLPLLPLLPHLPHLPLLPRLPLFPLPLASTYTP